MTSTDKIEPIHPGEVLREDFIEGFGISQNKLAVSIGVPPRRINEIVQCKRGISADTALRLAKYFGTSAEFWINLQRHYELDRAEDIAGEQIASISPLVRMSTSSREVRQKVVAYVIHNQRLLVFTHDDVALEVAGVQVPAGSISAGESPCDAAVREVWEETGLTVRVVRALGIERYDMWPSKPEVHERHFFELEVLDDHLPERWSAGEDDSSDGSPVVKWTCWWMPLRNAHALCAGFSTRIGELDY